MAQSTVRRALPALREPREALVAHWPEYLMEAAELGLFMISAGAFSVLFAYPGSFGYIADPLLQRGLVGAAMGLTAIA